jgi:hypothetical protein
VPGAGRHARAKLSIDVGPVGDHAALDARLSREACLKQPADPYHAVLHVVAALLARHESNRLVEPTEDFVVFVAEHDEGITPKHASVRAVSLAERLAAWDARWPAGVSRG